MALYNVGRHKSINWELNRIKDVGESLSAWLLQLGHQSFLLSVPDSQVFRGILKSTPLTLCFSGLQTIQPAFLALKFIDGRSWYFSVSIILHSNTLYLFLYTVLYCLTNGMHSEKGIIKWFCHCAYIIQIIWGNFLLPLGYQKMESSKITMHAHFPTSKFTNQVSHTSILGRNEWKTKKSWRCT